ncbi:MAG: hypothetical protein P4L56_07760 [Candidatus Sulfopaludibacter sp.]|nr:hypothetical protein [Candidatus Sulfopaludibacter sp.]
MQEFFTWFVWLSLFALLQYKICRSFPGIRSLFRNAFIATALLAILPATWILVRAPHGSPHLLPLLNHYFGIGVYAQTTLRAILELRWLAIAPFRLGAAIAHSAPGLTEEKQLLATMAALSQAIALNKSMDQGKGHRPVTWT